MSKFATVCRSLLIAAACLLPYASSLFAQSKTLERVYEPVVVEGNLLALLIGTTISDLTAYSYNAGTGQFTAIPFQIDEVSPEGRFLDENDGQVDGNDQIVFMPESTGDRAPTDKWVANTASNKRIEVAVTNGAGENGWIYLYSSVSPKPAVTPLLSYDRGPETAFADTVFGKSYTAVHDPTTGWFTDMRVAPPVGSGVDIVDRRKIRIAGSLSFLGTEIPITIHEDLVTFETVRQAAGPVRVIRELNGELNLSGNIFELPIVTQYFPYSNVFRLEDVQVPEVEGIKVREVRQTLDFNENAVGMSFYNPQNAGGLLINGTDDQKNDSLDTGLNWFMATGDPGTVLVLMGVPVLGEQRKLFYKDNSANDSEDTGDKKSYGDSGWSLRSSTTMTGTLGFDLITYFLAKVESGQTSAIGEQFKTNALNPYQVTAQEQESTSTAVSDNHNRPANFVLDDAQPNPFWPLRGSVRLSFSVPQQISSPTLRIYNLLGQEVSRFDFRGLPSAASKQQVVWDGRAANGQLLPAGIYFYQLQAGGQVATKKLVIIR